MIKAHAATPYDAHGAAASRVSDVVATTADPASILQPETFILSVLLTLLAVVTLAIIRQRNLFGVVILSGVYSFLMASVMMTIDAVDVAMTEAAVGAGISTVVLLAALHLTQSVEYPPSRNVVLPLFVAVVVGGALIYGTANLPPFGFADTPMHTHTAPKFIEMSKLHKMPPNMVTAVLADFRGFDTLGEVTVVFTGGIAVLMLLGGRRKVMLGQTPGEDEDGQAIEQADADEHAAPDTSGTPPAPAAGGVT